MPLWSESRSRKAISKELSECKIWAVPKVLVIPGRLPVRPSRGNLWRLDFDWGNSNGESGSHFQGPPSNPLVSALVQKQTETAVKKGKHGGRKTLIFDQIVVELVKKPRRQNTFRGRDPLLWGGGGKIDALLHLHS